MLTVKFRFDERRATGDWFWIGEKETWLLEHMHRNGQSLLWGLPGSESANSSDYYTVVLEEAATQRKHDPPWIRYTVDELKSHHISRPTVEVIGVYPGGPAADPCASRPAYILYVQPFAPFAPLRCGACFAPVPLYRVLERMSGGKERQRIDLADRVAFWMHAAQRYDWALAHGRVSVAMARAHRMRLGSDWNREGREVAETIARITRTPVYLSLALDRRVPTRCPACGQPWALKEPWHGAFTHRCTRCRLVGFRDERLLGHSR